MRNYSAKFVIICVPPCLFLKYMYIFSSISILKLSLYTKNIFSDKMVLNMFYIYNTQPKKLYYIFFEWLWVDEGYFLFTSYFFVLGDFATTGIFCTLSSKPFFLFINSFTCMVKTLIWGEGV